MNLFPITFPSKSLKNEFSLKKLEILENDLNTKIDELKEKNYFYEEEEPKNEESLHNPEIIEKYREEFLHFKENLNL